MIRNVIAIALSLIAIGCAWVRATTIEPPSQSLSDEVKMGIDEEIAREWNADNPRVRIEVVRHDGGIPRIEVQFLGISDKMMVEEASSKPIASDAETPSEDTIEEDSGTSIEEAYFEDYSDPYDPWLNNNPIYSGSTGYSGDGFMWQGTREYNGTTETWYSSNQAYHYRTGEWTVDDEGYYRDSEGYYVVATNNDEIPQDTVIETSKGQAKVYDGGADTGVTDFYTAF